jgi:hypothetical protein
LSEEAKEGPPTFDEAKTRELLGKLAVRMWRRTDQPPMALTGDEIGQLLWLGQDLDGFLLFCQKMGFLLKTEEGKFQFAEFRLRDYFAVPEFMKYLGSEYSDQGFIRDGAAAALEKIGIIAVPALIESLGHDDNAVNLGAAYALRLIGAPAIPGVLKALRSNDGKIRRWAIDALLSYENANAALQPLLGALHDKEFMVRANAAIALGKSKNNDAIPGLVQALDDSDSLVSSVAKRALNDLATPEARKALEDYQRRKGKAV